MNTPSQVNREERLVFDKVSSKMYVGDIDDNLGIEADSPLGKLLVSDKKAYDQFIDWMENKTEKALADHTESIVKMIENSEVKEKWWNESDEYDRGMKDMKDEIINALNEPKL